MGKYNNPWKALSPYDINDKCNFYGRDEDIGSDAHQNREGLQSDVTEVAVEFLSRGGTGDAHQTEAGNDQTQDQQKHIAFFGKILYFFNKSTHFSASFLEFFRKLYHCSLEK